MDDELSPGAAAAFDKLAALKRRYQTEADPVADLPAAADDEAADVEDIPVLTEAVIIADPAALGETEPDTPASLADWESALVERVAERVVERLRPELQDLLEEAVIRVLRDRAPTVYDTWLAGLRQRTRGAVLEVAAQDDPWDPPSAPDPADPDEPDALEGAAPS